MNALQDNFFCIEGMILHFPSLICKSFTTHFKQLIAFQKIAICVRKTLVSGITQNEDHLR